MPAFKKTKISSSYSHESMDDHTPDKNAEQSIYRTHEGVYSSELDTHSLVTSQASQKAQKNDNLHVDAQTLHETPLGDRDVRHPTTKKHSNHNSQKPAHHPGFFSLFFSAFFGWLGVMAVIFCVSIVALRTTGSPYWEPVRSFLAPIFLTGSQVLSPDDERDDKPGFFEGGISGLIDRVSPTKKFEDTTFLIVGIGGEYHDGGNLTDTIQVIHFGGREKVAMLSIPRDLTINMSNLGLGGVGKINELYGRSLQKNDHHKQPALEDLAKKVTEITGVKIDHVGLIDFQGFVDLIDTIGGIEVDVPKAIVDPTYPDHNYGYQTFRINAGKQILNGQTTLKYVRSRHSTSDFDRSERQQLVLQAIRDKMLSLDVLASPDKIKNLYEALEAHIHTDLGLTDIGLFALFAKDIPRDHVYAANISEGCYSTSSPCNVGGLLYTPDRSLTNNIWTLLPQGATVAQVSVYKKILPFVSYFFAHPEIRSPEYSMRIYTTQSALLSAYNMRTDLLRSGFQFDTETLRQLRAPTKTDLSSTGAIGDQIVFGTGGFADDMILISPLASETTRGVAHHLSKRLGLPTKEVNATAESWYVGSKNELKTPEIIVTLSPRYKFVQP